MKTCCFAFSIIIALLNAASCFDEAKKLHEEILRKSGYNKVIRPVKNASDYIDVSLGLKLSQLIDVVSSFFVTSLGIIVGILRVKIYDGWTTRRLSDLSQIKTAETL